MSRTSAYLKKVLEENPDIDGVAIVDANYRLFAIESKMKGELPSLEEVFIDIKSLKPGMVYVEPYLTKDFPYFVYYSPIVKDGKVLGVGAVFVHGHKFLSPLNIVFTRHKYHDPQVACQGCHNEGSDTKPLIEKGFPVLFDKDGVLLMAPVLGDNSVIGEEKRLNEIYNQIKDKLGKDNKYEGEIIYNGKVFIGSFAKFEMNRLPMIVGMLKNKNYILSTIEQGQYLSIASTGLLVLIIILVSIFLSEDL